MNERAAYLGLASLPRKRMVLETLELTGSALQTWGRLGHPGRNLMAELAEAERGGERLVTPADPEYPSDLLQVTEPPLALYLRGQPLPRAPGVALVGSRRATPYGIGVAERLGRDLACAGVTVVSGLARGIDAAAHLGALRATASSPVAVLGCGIGYDYPIDNRSLKRRLEAQGTVVSEYPGLEPPQAWRFPARNRIIAALAKVIVVVEAALHSGALITARLALELGRDVLVVPGDVGQPNSQGILKLLREGATPIGTAEHILEVLEIDATAYVPEPLPPLQQRVLDNLGPRGSCPDELVLSTRLSITEVLGALGHLQVHGRVRRVGPNFVAL